MNFFKYYKTYLKFATQDKKIYLGGWISIILLSIATNLSVLVLGNLVTQFKSGNVDLNSNILFIILTITLPQLVSPIFHTLTNTIYVNVTNKVDNQTYQKTILQDYDYHTKRSSGKLINIILNSSSLSEIYTLNFEISLVSDLLEALVIGIFMTIVNPIFSVVIILTQSILLYPTALAIKHSNKLRKFDKEKGHEVAILVADTLNSYETVRSFRKEGFEIQKFSNLSLEKRETLYNFLQGFRVFDLAIAANQILTISGISIVALNLYNSSSLTFASLIVIISYALSLQGKISKTIFDIRNCTKELTKVEDSIELLNLPNSVAKIGNETLDLEKPIKIEFRNIDFAYNPSKKIVDNLSLGIDNNEDIAFVGPSGGGKTTLVRLLLRYYLVNSGEILINGVNINELTEETLQQIFAIVPQDPVMFNQSLLYNIGYGLNIDPNELSDHKDEIIEVCKKAQIYDFIMSLPETFDTKVGERGIKLSGGQRQRVAIARALLKNPKVIIFDEATSMLDSESEYAIQLAISEIAKDKTMIFIAHRLSTIKHCDKIFVIDEGKLVESGTHESLIERNGIYNKIWQIQSGGFVKFK